MPQQSNQCKHLQYAFFLLDNGDLFSCDEAGEHFLQTIDVDIFYSHLQCLKLNTANVTSTIIINNTSYSLRLISVISLDEKKTTTYWITSMRATLSSCKISPIFPL